jgi:hypothetical protein
MATVQVPRILTISKEEFEAVLIWHITQIGALMNDMMIQVAAWPDETHLSAEVAAVCDFFKTRKWADEGHLVQARATTALKELKDVNVLRITAAMKNLVNEFTVGAQGITNAVALTLRAEEYATCIKLAIQELLTATSEYQRWVKELQKAAQVVLALK